MHGQNVQKHVEQEHRLELGLVQTLLPNTVELTVLEMLKKLRIATLTLAFVSQNKHKHIFEVNNLARQESIFDRPSKEPPASHNVYFVAVIPDPRAAQSLRGSKLMRLEAYTDRS